MGKRKIPPKQTGLVQWQKEDAFRRAEIMYLTDPTRRPPEYWWEQLCASCMPLQRFIERSRQERWVSRRTKYWEGVQQKVLNHFKYKTVHDQVAELERLTALCDDAHDAVKPKVIDGRKYYPVAPGSMEGMIGAITKLETLKADRRNEILTMIEPELIQEHLQQQGAAFNPEEMREVASLLLTKRMEAQRQLLEEHKDDDED